MDRPGVPAERHLFTVGDHVTSEQFRKEKNDRDRTRTCNLRIRSPTPYPLGHTVRVRKDVAHLLNNLYSRGVRGSAWGSEGTEGGVGGAAAPCYESIAFKELAGFFFLLLL